MLRHFLLYLVQNIFLISSLQSFIISDSDNSIGGGENYILI